MVILLLFIIGVSSIFLIFTKYEKNERLFHPPPGLRGLPLIGNLHQYDFLAPHVYSAKLAKTYGPIVSLRLGCAPIVVVQSAKLAKEVLKTQDLNFCSRPPTVGLQKLSYNGLDIAFSPYNEYFKEVKKICVVHLFNSIRVRSFAPMQQVEISRLINKISTMSSASSIVDLSELVTSFVCTSICKIAFGRSYEDDEGSRSKFRNLLCETQALFTAFAFSDYYPYLGHWFDKLTGNSARLEKTFRALDAFYEKIISDHLDLNIHNRRQEQEDIVDVLLHLRKERRSFAFDLSLKHVKAILMNIFVAGTDTSSAMVIWAMTELIKNPITMKKVQQEIRKNAPTKKDYIAEDDLQNMKYFKAMVKETFRLHPAVPLLVPRETIQKSKLEGYDILPKTVVLVNAWAIGRDPESWTDPEKFMPERFLGSSVDFKGQDFELIPFGAGRRICPGVNLGTVNVELTLANLLYSFDWGLPVGVSKQDIDTLTLQGITIHKKNSLCLVANKYFKDRI